MNEFPVASVFPAERCVLVSYLSDHAVVHLLSDIFSIKLFHELRQSGLQRSEVTISAVNEAVKYFRYRRISQMTLQPKGVGKMADFETLIPCISISSSQICTYFGRT